MNLAKLIIENSDVINENFEEIKLKGHRNRDIISGGYSKYEVSVIAKNCKSVKKIMTGNGRNNFIYVAPIGFNDFINSLPEYLRAKELEKKIENLGINKQTSRPKKKI